MWKRHRRDPKFVDEKREINARGRLNLFGKRLLGKLFNDVGNSAVGRWHLQTSNLGCAAYVPAKIIQARLDRRRAAIRAM